MFLRPLSAAVKVISGLSVWIHVHVERQPLASGAAELSLALSTSIFTVPTKVVFTLGVACDVPDAVVWPCSASMAGSAPKNAWMPPAAPVWPAENVQS